ncbi:hypothetical protein E2C01_092832 [Portunus trituberculatus]|uniref:Uncharacterized protein n=1 Tax=Portunus trituberculatus TaxID=210409 RepID=A0A5B7JYX7_PORTR|nr:hypothetical protein [Portunus trituberculatus]
MWLNFSVCVARPSRGKEAGELPTKTRRIHHPSPTPPRPQPQQFITSAIRILGAYSQTPQCFTFTISKGFI